MSLSSSSIQKGMTMAFAMILVSALSPLGFAQGIVDQTNDPGVRTAVIRRLLTADSEVALRGYLSLVHDPATRAEAFAVADELTNPPLDALLAHLDDDDQIMRVSSALVLGRVNGPKVTQALIDRVMQRPRGQVEAWAALLACRGELAGNFISYASGRPRLLAQVNNAQVQWMQLIQ